MKTKKRLDNSNRFFLNQKIMKSKKLFLPSIFLLLLFPAATQCMEKEIVQPPTMQEIRDDRNTIYEQRFSYQRSICWPLDLALFQENWKDTLDFLENGKSMGLNTSHDVLKEQVQKLNYGDNKLIFEILHNPKFYAPPYSPYECSALGFATIAIKKERIHSDTPILRGRRKEFFQNKQAQIQALFSEKKAYIKKLISFDIEPTPNDRELALLTTYEEFGAAIIAKKLLLQQYASSLLLSEIHIPQDILNDILLLMFKTESLL